MKLDWVPRSKIKPTVLKIRPMVLKIKPRRFASTKPKFFTKLFVWSRRNAHLNERRAGKIKPGPRKIKPGEPKIKPSPLKIRPRHFEIKPRLPKN